MRRQGLVAVLAIVAVAACGGGSSAPANPPVPFYEPTVALRDVRMSGVGLTGGAMDIDLNVYNPNDYRLVAPRVTYRVYVGDVELAKGFADIETEVQSRDSTRLTVPVKFSYIGAGRAGKEALGSGIAIYRVVGRIYVGTPYGRVASPYDRQGSYSPMAKILGGIGSR